MNNKAQTEVMDRAGELPMERRVAERRSGSQDATIAALKGEELSLHRQLATEKLRADQGWQRYESANASHQSALATIAALNQQLAAARNEALVEAAQECSMRSRNWLTFERETDLMERGEAAKICAAAIRALASHPAAPVQPAISEHGSALRGIVAEIHRCANEGEPYCDFAVTVTHGQYLALCNEAAEPAAPPVQSDLERDALRYRWLRNPTTDVALVIDKRSGFVPEDESVPGVGGYHTYEYRAGGELDAAIDGAMGKPAAPPVQQTGDVRDLHSVYDLFGIGSEARNISTLTTCIRNTIKFADLLAAVEREFFMVPGEPDEDDPSAEPDDVCLVDRWGSTEQEYIEQFRAALATTRPSAALTDERIMHIAMDEAITWVTDEGRPDNSTIISFSRAILAASGGAHAVPEDVARDAARYRHIRERMSEWIAEPEVYNFKMSEFDQDVDRARIAAAPTQDQGEGK